MLYSIYFTNFGKTTFHTAFFGHIKSITAIIQKKKKISHIEINNVKSAVILLLCDSDGETNSILK